MGQLLGCKFFIVGLLGKLDLQECDKKMDKKTEKISEFWSGEIERWTWILQHFALPPMSNSSQSKGHSEKLLHPAPLPSTHISHISPTPLHSELPNAF